MAVLQSCRSVHDGTDDETVKWCLEDRLLPDPEAVLEILDLPCSNIAVVLWQKNGKFR